MRVYLILFSSCVLLFGYKSDKDFVVTQASIHWEVDSISQNSTYWLQLECSIDPERVQRFALTEKRKDGAIEQFNIVRQEDGFYCQSKDSYRKVYDGKMRYSIKLPSQLKTRDLKITYFINGEPQTIGL